MPHSTLSKNLRYTTNEIKDMIFLVNLDNAFCEKRILTTSIWDFNGGMSQWRARSTWTLKSPRGIPVEEKNIHFLH